MKKDNKKKKKKNKQSSFPKNLSNSIELDSRFNLFEVIIMILIAVIFGVIIGYSITYGNSNLSRVRTDSNLGEIVRTYNNIIDNYYGDLDEKKLSESAIKGMISSLDDPYSIYLNEGRADSFNESVDGQYVGIGVSLFFDGENNRISSVVKDGPADKAGILKDDVILKIDGVDCQSASIEEIDELISGEVGSNLSIVIGRGDEAKHFTVTRNIIEVKNVEGRVIQNDNHKVGYIKIHLFSSNSYDQFLKVMEKLEKKNVDSFVLDVRDNPGGHLVQVKNILSVFFNKKTVLYQVENRYSKKKIYSSTDSSKSLPVVVLINQETASSAEVLAACFQENYKNVHLVGTRSYGKGNVQKSLSLSGGASIKFTIEKWLTPSGKDVSSTGVIPDILIEEESEEDLSLEKALELLK